MSKKQVFASFPYDRKFTRAEIAELLERAKVVGDAMRDGQGPNGAILGLLPDLFELWMIHAALAGVTVDESKALIRPRKVFDKSGQQTGVEWVLKKEDSAAARAQDVDREARMHAAQIQSLPPKVREALVDMFTKKAERVEERRGGDAAEDEPLAALADRNEGEEASP